MMEGQETSHVDGWRVEVMAKREAHHSSNMLLIMFKTQKKTVAGITTSKTGFSLLKKVAFSRGH
jgi:hypothetical protein